MLQNISSLRDEFDIFIFDVYGVIWDGSAMFPRALEVMEDLHKAGKTVIVMSNAAARSQVLVDEGAVRGYIRGIHYERILSAGDLAHMVFSHDDRPLRYFIYGRQPSPARFEGSIYQQVDTPDEADFIYLGFPGHQHGTDFELVYTIDDFILDLQAFRQMDKPLVCANPDYVAYVGLPQPVVCEGMLAAYYEKIGGKVAWFGKPEVDIYEHLLQDYDVPRSRVLMLGDTLRTDIAGAKAAGIKSALLLTGVSYREMINAGQTDIKAWSAAQGICPDYYLQTL